MDTELGSRQTEVGGVMDAKGQRDNCIATQSAWVGRWKAQSPQEAWWGKG